MKHFQKIKQLTLRNVGDEYIMAHAVGDDSMLTDIYTLNETAAWIWQMLDTTYISIDDLTERLCQKYDVDPSVAKDDIVQQLNQWDKFGLILITED